MSSVWPMLKHWLSKDTRHEIDRLQKRQRELAAEMDKTNLRISKAVGRVDRELAALERSARRAHHARA